MNENIDLTEILEGCEGVELWSPLCGKCKLSKIDKDLCYPIMVNTLTNADNERSLLNIVFTKEGHYHCLIVGGECILFPSEEQRDWSKFERPIKEGTPVMCCKDGYCLVKDYWVYGKYTKKEVADWLYVIPFAKFDPKDIEGSIRDYNIQK